MSLDRRRFLLQSGSAAAVVALFGQGCAAPAADKGAGGALGFTGVPASLRDGVVIPPEYEWQLLYPWGTPTGITGIGGRMPAFSPDASNSADDQAAQAGMHHDGMHFFALDASGDRGLLVMNHEYTDEQLLHTDGVKQWTPEKVRKSLHAMGVSVIEIRRTPEGWRQVLPSPFARRVHGNTPMRIAGPAAGTPLMRTAANPAGDAVFGTFANCAMGVTPWGTYLTCEENFHGYFGGPKEAASRMTAAQRRYGTVPGSQWVEYWRFDERFDLSRHPNEPHRFGWVVEIDPFDPTATPIKRTALGRKRQESATCTVAKDGRLVVYMGDDSRFEYIYKFVSRDKVRPGTDAQARAANRHLLDEGTLYVARYDAGGRGQWLELTHGRGGLDAAGGFADQAEVLIHARLAGDVVGGTKMDRPEWIAVHPQTGEVYVTLTNNSQRGDAGKPGPDAANPRANNLFGGILRWREDGGDAAGTGFAWDHFALAGDPAQPGSGTRYPSAEVDMFGAPDGLHFDRGGLLWIQTDMSGQVIGKPPYTSLGNNQMLCADPASGRIKRFLTGPNGCEITGCVVTPDRRTLFVNIQHPGEARDDGDTKHNSAWPDGTEPGSARPRSATLAIRRRDGGIVGT
ncbi:MULTISPECIES: PhoX family protein [Variovorax]|uniref:PhoX family protein n=1 Tax=Variovorax TaxID=34072 RepID=UPI00086F117E|nr:MULTISPECIES: PhoX family phosphatase [Variovorax]MBN8758604.1 PhoX family phosphatase [Variovorax sp.]ODU12005.1 MAG: Tat pathway signal protein [Variovorax sp. SCN 67-85]ODV15142.1 MAG: Tat pathway signal protein [Variovorax sp. SCN 67-20]OJZ05287.1 MAG: Tat pathway signal protein [Variovorax sp. 67-131]UKI05274.1 PhoX family phosphatase [Variovorax paradoxus]